MGLSSTPIGDFDGARIDALALAWLNAMDAAAMDAFFWDYPGPAGGSTSGIGLGRQVAQRLVEERARRPDGFADLAQVLAVRGLGKDKLTDLRTQAAEALALARHAGLQADAALLRQRLAAIGRGRPLLRVTAAPLRCALRVLAAQARTLKDAEIEFEFPFVALAWQRGAGGSAPTRLAQFARVRLEAWAFAVHPPACRWRLHWVRRRDGERAWVSKGEADVPTQ